MGFVAFLFTTGLGEYVRYVFYFFQASKMHIQASQGEDCQHCYFCSLVFDAESVFFCQSKDVLFQNIRKKLKTAIPLSATVDGSEIPNNHLGCIKPCK